MLEGIIFIASLVVLLYSADKLVDAAVVLATKLEVSPMVIGLTVVAIGTSLPELMASATAAVEGYPQIAVANVLGSNVANVGLILGLPALFFPILCSRRTVMREGMLMLLASVVVCYCFFVEEGMSRTWGVLSLLAFLGFLYVAVSGVQVSEQAEDANTASVSLQIAIILLSIVFLLGSSIYLVDSTVALATMLGISEKVIAISLIAFGTSVPELSVSISAARKGQGDILVGNILGSNVSNILLVLGLTAVINPFTTTEVVGWVDPVVMTALALAMLYFLSQSKGITRFRGGLLLATYFLFIVGNAVSEFWT